MYVHVTCTTYLCLYYVNTLLVDACTAFVNTISSDLSCCCTAYWIICFTCFAYMSQKKESARVKRKVLAFNYALEMVGGTAHIEFEIQNGENSR